MGNLSDAKDEVVRLYFDEGWSYQAIADLYGRSREAVRILLNRYNPDREPGVVFRQRLRDEEKKSKKVVQDQVNLREAPPCVVCFNPVTKKAAIASPHKHWTCCHEHAVLWSRARFILDDELWEQQIASTARSILRYPEEHDEGEVAWADRITSGEISPQRRFTRKGSKSQQAFEEVMGIRERGDHEC